MNEEIYREIASALDREEPVVLATVARTRGSTPRKTGAKMVVRSDGSFFGTIGGGCGEAEVWQEAMEVLEVLSLTHLANEYAGNLSGGQKKRLELDRDGLRFIVASAKANLAERPEHDRIDLEQRIAAAELLHAEAAALLAMLEADTSGYLVCLDQPIGGFAPSEEEQKVLDDKFRDLTEADVAAAVDWKRRVGLMRNHLELLA